MTEFTAPSGVTVIINPAPWKDAKGLKSAIERSVAIGGGLNLSTILLVDSSEEVDAALAKCLARCLYGNEKITDQTFDKAEARQDYYDIVTACVKENLGPLAESLRSKLLEYGILSPQAPTKDTPKSQ